eukprot:m.17195 g.17195  ORF g.17195 m.17195 type:complete len:59 (+) comp5147_c0_seq2:1710-1886(+)
MTSSSIPYSVASVHSAARATARSGTPDVLTNSTLEIPHKKIETCHRLNTGCLGQERRI